MNETLYDLDLIKSSISDDDLLKKIFILFEEQSILTLQQMKTSCSNKDWNQVFFCAHKLKSSLILFQIKQAIEDVNFIEANAKDKTEINTIPEKVNSLTSTVKKAIFQMEKEK